MESQTFSKIKVIIYVILWHSIFIFIMLLKFMVFKIINLETVNKELEELSSIDRIKWVHNQSYNMMILTSGGKKYSVVPHLVKSALPNEIIPIIFVDIECYDNSTYAAIEKLKKEGNDIRTYRPSLSLAHDEAIYGKILGRKDLDINNYKAWCIRRKKDPLDRAIKDLKPDFIVGGRTKYQSSRRQLINCLERRGDLYQFNPIFDWDDQQILMYMERFDLNGNSSHTDPTKRYDEDECPIWNYNI